MRHTPSATARGWFKSSFSTASGDCVEVRFDGDLVRVRDTKDRGRGPVISVGAGRWETFTRGVRAGGFGPVIGMDRTRWASAGKAEPEPVMDEPRAVP